MIEDLHIGSWGQSRHRRVRCSNPGSPYNKTLAINDVLDDDICLRMGTRIFAQNRTVDRSVVVDKDQKLPSVSQNNGTHPDG
jgi:hypothetical protein